MRRRLPQPIGNPEQSSRTVRIERTVCKRREGFPCGDNVWIRSLLEETGMVGLASQRSANDLGAALLPQASTPAESKIPLLRRHGVSN